MTITLSTGVKMPYVYDGKDFLQVMINEEYYQGGTVYNMIRWLLPTTDSTSNIERNV